LDRPEAATGHFEEALRLHEQLRAQPLLAHTRLQYAAALVERRAAGSIEQARVLAERARDDAAALGMPLVQARASAVLERAVPSQPARPAMGRLRNPDGLTAREVEVLTLLAEGATNAQIAQILVLSTGTVHSHTVKIYQKIGARGRAEAAAYAVRNGMTGRV
jgi:DNA-binding NarL/FixJ family response regulator